MVEYNGNLAIAEGGTAGPVSLSIALEGEPLQASTMTITPAAVENYFNVSAFAYIDVPKGCCQSISIENTSTQAASVANSNLIVTREA